MRSDIEHQEQVAFFQYVDLKMIKQYPFLSKLLFTVPNGGQRSKAQAGKLKAEGVRAGVSDIVLLYASRGFNYLSLEMKTVDGKQSDQQKVFEKYVDENNGLYQVVYNSHEALNVLSWYLRNKD